MIISRDRILTTHVGSLPRNETLTDLLVRREAGEAIDPKPLATEMDKAVAEIVKKQQDSGIDIGNDGEQQRVGFQTYMASRMSGYGGQSKRRTAKDLAMHPDQFATFARRFPHGCEAAQRAAGHRGGEIHRYRHRSRKSSRASRRSRPAPSPRCS